MKVNKIIVITAELRKLLAPMSGVINANTVLPILENALFEINKNVVTVTATDLENVIVANFTVVNKGDDFNITIPFKMLYQFLVSCEAESFIMQVDNYFKIIISTAGDDIVVNIKGENPDNYPKSPVLEYIDFNYGVKADIITGAFRRASLFCSRDDLRPSMTGVYMCNHHDYIHFVATDAHRLRKESIVKVNKSGWDKQSMDIPVIVPYKGCRLVSELFKSKKEEILLMQGNSKFTKITGDGHIIYIRNIEARYPRWTEVWPSDLPFKFHAKRKQLKSLLTLAFPFANKSTNHISFSIGDDSASVETKDIDFDFSCKFKLPLYNTVGSEECKAWAVNGKFLHGCLSMINDDIVSVQYSSATKAIIIDNDTLLMPLMLNE